MNIHKFMVGLVVETKQVFAYLRELLFSGVEPYQQPARVRVPVVSLRYRNLNRERSL